MKLKLHVVGFVAGIIVGSAVGLDTKAAGADTVKHPLFRPVSSCLSEKEVYVTTNKAVRMRCDPTSTQTVADQLCWSTFIASGYATASHYTLQHHNPKYFADVYTISYSGLWGPYRLLGVKQTFKTLHCSNN